MSFAQEQIAPFSENNRPHAQTGESSASVDRLIHSLTSTLSSIDEVCQHEREAVIRDPRHGNLKAHILRMLEKRHQQRRVPYLRQLAVLDAKMRLRAR